MTRHNRVLAQEGTIERVDVLVVGAGPAGMALAAACSQRGLTVGLLDPNPERRWVATYGMWSPELPADLPVSAVAARAAGRAIALTEHRLGWEYVVLDVDALRAHLVDRSAGVTVYAGRAVGSPARGVVALADGSTLRASVVVDATGRSRPLDPNRTRRVSAEQTAYGMILDEASLAPLVAPAKRCSWIGAAITASQGGRRFCTSFRWAAGGCSLKRPHWRAGPDCHWRPCAAGWMPGSHTTASPCRKTHARKRFHSQSTKSDIRDETCSGSARPHR